MSKLSVIIPVYKVEAYLDRCVESVLAQTHTDLEIFLVDDGSPDNCPQMCDQWAKIDARIRVIHKENGGQGSARNMALDVMTGDFVLFIDSDDIVHPQMCELLLAVMREEGSDLILADLQKFSDTEAAEGALSFPAYTPSELPRQTVAGEKWYQSELCYFRTEVTCRIFRKEIFSALRFRTDIIYEDTHLTPYLVKRARKITHCPIPLYFYRQNDGSTMRSPLTAKKLTVIDIFAEHYRMFAKEKYPTLANMAATELVFRIMKIRILCS